jgi:hypothetical protein
MPESLPSREAFKNQQQLQFSDGHTALGFNTPDDVIAWGAHKYANPETSAEDTILVKTTKGRRLALGKGVAVQLPALDQQTGKFVRGKEGGDVSGVALSDLPNGLTDIVIGQPWDVIGADPDEAVENVLLGYKWTNPGDQSMQQIPMPNPFDSAKEYLEHAAAHLRG